MLYVQNMKTKMHNQSIFIISHQFELVFLYFFMFASVLCNYFDYIHIF